MPLLQRIFADKPQNYYVSCTSLKAVAINIASHEITPQIFSPQFRPAGKGKKFVNREQCAVDGLGAFAVVKQVFLVKG